jgi:hypothetical protein
MRWFASSTISALATYAFALESFFFSDYSGSFNDIISNITNEILIESNAEVAFLSKVFFCHDYLVFFSCCFFFLSYEVKY